MVKSYLKYEHSKTFGVITAASSNAVWIPDENAATTPSRTTGAGRAVVGANEEVLCWDIKKGELLDRWKDKNCSVEVTVIVRSKADPDIFAVGYGDGSIRLWDSRIATAIISFNGHRSAITLLTFDRLGTRLASGSKDTEIVVWDLVSEVGLYRLRGHKDQITGLHFLDLDSVPASDDADAEVVESLANKRHPLPVDDDSAPFLLSTSKDALIKLWDLRSKYCIETHIVQNNGECWYACMSHEGSGCITAGNDGELKIWAIDLKGLREVLHGIESRHDRNFLRDRGIIHRQGKDRTLGITIHPHGSYIAVHGSEKAVEFWRIRSESEVQKKLARKRKRKREKGLLAVATDENADQDMDGADERPEDELPPSITDIIVPHLILRTGGRVRSVGWANGRNRKSLQLLVATTNNQIEIYQIIEKQSINSMISDQASEYSRTVSVDMPGHRTDIRSLTLSSDDRMLASASNGSLKVWNIRTQSCLRTLECGYALCSSFLPGDKIVIVGNRNGELELFDISSSTVIDTVKAHEGPIWTLQVHPDGKSMATGSADKCVKFWTFEVVQEEVPGTRRTAPRFSILHKRTLKVSDDILNLRFSPDSRMLAVALLDNTVKIFFTNSLKLFLNLYGHKLPVLSMDISYDSKLIVTCSADKNVRIWGLDFGDCHKAIFAHQDSIMQVVFVPHNQDGNGHHFFSAGKDQFIKYFDGDKFEQIQKLQGHHGEIWAMSVSHTGEFIVSASHDKSIRVWQQTDEQIFLEEEREKELEELYENTLTTSLDQEDANGEEKSEVAAAGKQTIETVTAGERIAEALEIGIADLEVMREWRAAKAAQPNIVPPARSLVFMAFGNISAELHVLNTVQKIKASTLQDALLVLPFDKVSDLFSFLRLWAERGWNIPLTCRILFFLLKTHHQQIVASKAMRPMLDDIRGLVRASVQQQKDEMGFNMAALKFLNRRVRDQETSNYVDDVEVEEDPGKGRKKRGFIDVA